MSRGCFVAVVGPSGAGKDTLIAAALLRRPDIVKARRVITRPPDAGGEEHDFASEAEFLSRAAAGGFALAWQAHGFRYGIPAAIGDHLVQGRHVLANLSRSAIGEARARFEPARVLWITAPPEALARRLAARCREPEGEIAARVGRTAPRPPPDAWLVDNGGPLEHGLAAFLDALPPCAGVREGPAG